ncbi:MAG: hypothetical protein ACYC5O_16035 [Anaerolineae bacterium]
MTHVWRYLAGLAATAVAVAAGIMAAGYLILVDRGTANGLLAAAILAMIAVPFVWIVVVTHRGANVPLFSAAGMLLFVLIIIPGLDLVVPYFVGKHLLRHRFPY